MVKLVCEHCGKEYYRSPSHAIKSKHHFCCKECSQTWQKNNPPPQGEDNLRYNRIETTCEYCGKKVMKIPSRLTIHNFCCKEHQKAYEKDGGYPELRHRETLTCEQCGTQFERMRSKANTDTKKFCCKECLWKWQKTNNPKGEEHYNWQGGEEKRNCLNCGKEFYITHNLVNDEHHGKYCSYKCYTEHREYPRGENHPRWNPIRGKQSLRKSVEYREWRMAVFKRDNFTCQKCHKQGVKLNAHHIYEYAKYEDVQLSLSNGITLCKKCHKKIHKKDSKYVMQIKLL